MKETGYWNQCVVCKEYFPATFGVDWGLKDWKCEAHRRKSDPELIEEIINDLRKELIKSRMNERYWTMEAVDPKKVGKHEAEEKLAIWQKHVKSVEGQIETLKAYRKETYERLPGTS